MKKNMIYQCLFLSALASALAPSSAVAAKTVEEAIAGCYEIQQFPDHHYPGKESIKNSNNLRRQTGSAFNAKGVPIFIKGKVMDAACKPVQGARVDIWQADESGRYLADEDFSASGRVFTNNLGEYSFISILPGKANDGSAPHINFLVVEKGAGEIVTRMYFPENEADNMQDTALQKSGKDTYPYGVKKVRKGHDDTYYYNIRLNGYVKNGQVEVDEKKSDKPAEESTPASKTEDSQ